MADFRRYSNYTEETSFSEVVFAADSPLLEVEMNELQQILENKIGKIYSVNGDNYYPNNTTDDGWFIANYNDTKVPMIYPDGTYIGNDYRLSLSDGFVLSKKGYYVILKGVIVHLGKLNLTWQNTLLDIYVKSWIEDATKDSDLREYGYIHGKTIENKILDPRWANETSRRKVLKYDVGCGESTPEDTSVYTYTKIGTVIFDSNWREDSQGHIRFFRFVRNTTSEEKINQIYEQAQISNAKEEILNSIGLSYFGGGAVTGKTVTGATVPYVCFKFNKEFIGYNALIIAHISIDVSVTGVNNLGKAVLNISSGFCESNGDTIEVSDDGVIWTAYETSNIRSSKRNSLFTLIAHSPAKYDSKAIGYQTSTSNKQFIVIPVSIYAEYGDSQYFVIENGQSYKYIMNSDDQWVEDTENNVKISCTIVLDDIVKLGPIDLDTLVDMPSKLGAIQLDYNNLNNKPSINDVTLVGNKTSSDLHIEGGSGGTMNYEDLENLPTLNGVEIKGAMQESDPVYTQEHISSSEVDIMLDNIFGEA